MNIIVKPYFIHSCHARKWGYIRAKDTLTQGLKIINNWDLIKIINNWDLNIILGHQSHPLHSYSLGTFLGLILTTKAFSQ